MFKILWIIGLFFIGTYSCAEEIPVTITPVKKISTSNKNLRVGDIVYFKDVKSGEEINALVKEIQPNSFAGKEASLYITNFKYSNSNTPLHGQIYINGGEHKKYQAMADAGLVPANIFIRGGEVILKPEKTKLTIFFNDYDNFEEAPLKIKPAQIISTCYDEIEVGDKIKFEVVKDFYKNGKLYIKKDTPVYGLVDYVSANGWNFDNAQIDFKQFRTKTITGDKLTIHNPLSINGYEILKYKSNRMAQMFNYCGLLFRGKEVEIIPNKDSNIEFNIFIKNQ